MATSIGDLVQRARWKTNTEANTFVTDQELATVANDCLGELDDILVGLYEDFKLAQTTLTITSNVDGQNNFALPVDFLKSRKVERQWGGDWVTLFPFSLQEHSALTHPILIRNGTGWLGYYRIEGPICEVLPWQNAAGTYRLWYVQSFTPLTFSVDANGAFTTSTATLPAYMDTQAWHAFAVAGICIHVQQKQDLDAGVYVQERETQRQRVIGAGKSRDAGPPKKVADVRRRNGALGRWGWGR